MSRQNAKESPGGEVAQSAQRRRWSLAEKLRIVEESSRPGISISFVARKYGIAPNLLFRWRKLMSEGGPAAVRTGEQLVSPSDLRRLEMRVRELERLLGRKTMELELLKEALDRKE